MNTAEFEYAGFWIRACAAVIDTVLVICITFPFLIAVYGWNYITLTDTALVAGWADFLISWVAPAIAVVMFWLYRQATPGKMLFALHVVDAHTGNPLTPPQAIKRYLGYYAALIPLGLGILWVAFDPKKQGWHDKLAKTVVIQSRQKAKKPEAVDEFLRP